MLTLPKDNYTSKDFNNTTVKFNYIIYHDYFTAIIITETINVVIK